MSEYALKPLLQKFPDGRAGTSPLLEPVLLPYVAIMFGSLVAGILGAYNAAVLRRYGLLFRSLFVGALGWIAFLFVVGFVTRAGANVSVALIIGRLFHFAMGGVLLFIQRPFVRGHTFLSGPMAPMLSSYMVAFMFSMFLPWKVTRFLLGVWLVD
jgi:hypothetical protein